MENYNISSKTVMITICIRWGTDRLCRTVKSCSDSFLLASKYLEKFSMQNNLLVIENTPGFFEEIAEDIDDTSIHHIQGLH